MTYTVDVLGGLDSVVGYGEPSRVATGAGRFAPAGLLRRRRPGTGTYYGNFSGQASARPVGGVQRLSRSPLPVGLLPLPAGFDPHTAAG